MPTDAFRLEISRAPSIALTVIACDVIAYWRVSCTWALLPILTSSARLGALSTSTYSARDTSCQLSYRTVRLLAQVKKARTLHSE